MIGTMRTTAALVSVGSAVPERVVTNDEISQLVDTSDAWIVERTGIRERRVAADDEFVSDLGFRAAEQALDRSGLAPADIDLVLVATTSPDAYQPATAVVIADRLGAHSAGAYDLSAACSGFTYGLVQALGQVSTGLAQHALVVGADTLTKQVDWTDRSTCILFGDGAGAVVLSAGAAADHAVGVELGADGARASNLIVRALEPGARFLEMNGREVFKFAARVMEDSTTRVVEACGLELGDVDWIVPHQANSRIIDHAVKKLGLRRDRVLMNLDRYGNTSAASIPLCLDEAWLDGRLQRGHRLLMIGFGGGLTWGTSLMEWAGDGSQPPPEGGQR